VLNVVLRSGEEISQECKCVPHSGVELLFKCALYDSAHLTEVCINLLQIQIHCYKANYLLSKRQNIYVSFFSTGFYSSYRTLAFPYGLLDPQTFGRTP
jgi:hypothetical protein